MLNKGCRREGILIWRSKLPYQKDEDMREKGKDVTFKGENTSFNAFTQKGLEPF